MELALTLFNVGAGLGILAVGVAVAYVAWRVTPLIAETRMLTQERRRLARTTDAELRPLLDLTPDVPVAPSPGGWRGVGRGHGRRGCGTVGGDAAGGSRAVVPWWSRR